MSVDGDKKRGEFKRTFRLSDDVLETNKAPARADQYRALYVAVRGLKMQAIALSFEKGNARIAAAMKVLEAANDEVEQAIEDQKQFAEILDALEKALKAASSALAFFV